MNELLMSLSFAGLLILVPQLGVLHRRRGLGLDVAADDRCVVATVLVLFGR